MMNFPLHPNPWQLMYTQLLNQYSTLAHNYHQQTEINNSLYRQLEQVMEEKVSLLQGIASPMPTQASLPLAHPQEEVAREPAREIAHEKRKRIKRNLNSIRRNGKVYKCKYSECIQAYHSLISLKQHMRVVHGDAAKKERQIVRKDIL